MNVNGALVTIEAVFPPVPSNLYDWRALWPDTEEFGPYGYGPSPLAAVEDLLYTFERVSDMGLDIWAYSDLAELKRFDSAGEPLNEQGEQIKNYVRIFANPDFPGRADDLKDRGAYEFKEARHALGMSYGRYSEWREKLAELGGYEEIDQPVFGRSRAASCWRGAKGPFWELINFADNEGVIGAECCARLLKDFVDFDGRAKELGDSFYVNYSSMKSAFQTAADRGAVVFR